MADTPRPASSATAQPEVPDDPSQQILPQATLEPVPVTGVPMHWEALRQERIGDDWTLSGEVVLYYRNYILHADKIVYHQPTSAVEATGHLQLEGGPNDTILTASHGEMNLDQHTARFYDVAGSFGVRRVGHSQIYSTPDPFIFTGRVLIQTGENNYHIVDGSMTSCRLPKPDWELISRSIDVANGKATTRNSIFEFLRVPLFYLPFIQHNLDENGRESGILLDGFENSGVKGFVIGEQVYWVINRSMDITVGAQYWSKRGFAPNGDFRYRGPGIDALTVRWSALLDRGIEETLAGAKTPTLQNQGGADILAFGRKDLTPHTRVAGSIEYLSSYIYRLAFDENLAQATSSEVQSDLALTHAHRGFIPSISFDRFQSFAGTNANGEPVTSVPEARILHLPNVRFDAIDRPFANTPVLWGVGSSIGDLERAEPTFHARNVGRLDLYPHIEWPIHVGDWNILPQLGLRTTQYSGSQIPDLTGANNGVPLVQHNPLNRSDLEVSLDIRPPAVERDFTLSHLNRQLRHVIEPEVFYRYVTGINNARDILHFDTTDIATNTNEAGFSLTQRFYVKPLNPRPCETEAPCEPPAREWASWQISQKYFIDSDFGGALIPNRRNVFDTTLDMTGVAYLTSSRNIAPIVSRMRFEAIDNLRIEWDLDYDTKAGRLGANNLFAGYSFGRTTIGLGHALLNAADETGSQASLIQSHEISPFLYFGKPSDVGLSVALNSSYDFTHGALQYGGIETIYNWNCCGLILGYRRFALGSLRDETEWLYGFTLSGIGTAGNVHRSTSVFPAPEVLKYQY
ncbi:LPS-assembly protein LptD [Acidicapsa ligni]|uniref:LPS-assembly protein LptD n=1 Tax=Acidicapsa ligni TaxID=542300 RepID=UPI0021DF45E1|nr:LPS assembly protein LptD [Acidicapsa ligni]